MSAFAGPEISSDSLVLAFDAGNIKSYDGNENLFPWSETFTAGNGWGGGGTITLDSSIVDPSGNTGTVYYPTVSEWTRNFNGLGVTTIALSFFTKIRPGGSGSTTRIQIYQETAIGEPSNVGVYDFDMVGSNPDSGRFTDITRTEYPNGWYRFTCKITSNPSAGSGTFTSTSRVDLEGGGTTNYVWGIQIERGSVANPYYKTTGTSKTRGTTWSDLSGNGNTGTLLNTPTYNSNNGGTLVFDGTNDYVDTPLSGPTTFLSTSNFSISSWIRFTSLVQNNAGTICGVFNYDGYGLFWKNDIETDNSLVVGAQMRTRGNGNITNIISSTLSPIQINTWYFVSMSYSSSQNFILLYLNNTQVSNFTSIPAGTYLNITDKNITIGSNGVPNGGSLGAYFPGNIAQVSIYNRALTAAEIQQNFNALRGRYGI